MPVGGGGLWDDMDPEEDELSLDAFVHCEQLVNVRTSASTKPPGVPG